MKPAFDTPISLMRCDKDIKRPIRLMFCAGSDRRRLQRCPTIIEPGWRLRTFWSAEPIVALTALGLGGVSYFTPDYWGYNFWSDGNYQTGDLGSIYFPWGVRTQDTICHYGDLVPGSWSICGDEDRMNCRGTYQDKYGYYHNCNASVTDIRKGGEYYGPFQRGGVPFIDGETIFCELNAVADADYYAYGDCSNPEQYPTTGRCYPCPDKQGDPCPTVDNTWNNVLLPPLRNQCGEATDCVKQGIVTYNIGSLHLTLALVPPIPPDWFLGKFSLNDWLAADKKCMASVYLPHASHRGLDSASTMCGFEQIEVDATSPGLSIIEQVLTPWPNDPKNSFYAPKAIESYLAISGWEEHLDGNFPNPHCGCCGNCIDYKINGTYTPDPNEPIYQDNPPYLFTVVPA